MSRQFATAILQWEYDAPYDFYNSELNDEGLEELLEGSYCALVDSSNNLVGFFCTGKSAQVPIGNQFGVYKEDFIDMGLGMHPKLVGKGNGFEFCSIIMNYLKGNYEEKPLRLTVAKFNRRATCLYEKLGFVYDNEFRNDTTAFITMVNRDY